MGLIRKSMSLGTLGAVDMRSDKERTAAYTKEAKKQAKKQTAIMEQQARQQSQFQQAQLAMQLQAQQPGTPAQAPEAPKVPAAPVTDEEKARRLASVRRQLAEDKEARKAEVATPKAPSAFWSKIEGDNAAHAAQRAENKARREAEKVVKAAAREDKKEARKAGQRSADSPGQSMALQPGWYADGQNDLIVRWHDGTAWTAHTQPRHDVNK